MKYLALALLLSSCGGNDGPKRINPGPYPIESVERALWLSVQVMREEYPSYNYALAATGWDIEIVSYADTQALCNTGNGNLSLGCTWSGCPADVLRAYWGWTDMGREVGMVVITYERADGTPIGCLADGALPHELVHLGQMVGGGVGGHWLEHEQPFFGPGSYEERLREEIRHATCTE